MSLRHVFLVLILSLLLVGCEREELYSDLSELDANTMLGFLLARKIDAEKVEVKGKFTLTVPKNQFPDAVDTLQWFGLPKQQYSNLGELFQKSGMISSPTEEKIRYMYGLSQTIAETLSNINGVIIARVNLVLPNNDPFNGSVRPSSASVFLKVRPGRSQTVYIPQIKDLVMDSVEGLSYDRITVTIIPADSIDYFSPLLVNADSNKNSADAKTSNNSKQSFPWFLIFCIGIFCLIIGGLVMFYFEESIYPLLISLNKLLMSLKKLIYRGKNIST